MVIAYVASGKEEPVEIIKDSISNGDIAVIKESQYPYEADAYYLIKIKGTKNSVIRIEVRTSSDLDEINLNSPMLYGHLMDEKEEECHLFTVDTPQSGDRYRIDITTTTNNLNIFYRETTGTENSQFVVESNKFVVLDESERVKKPRICIKSRGGAASYGIQISELKVSQTINNIEPAVNGLIYTYALQPKQYQYYRHFHTSIQNKSDPSSKKVETTYYLRRIIGNPIMYVAKCEYYPNCFYDSQSVEQGIINGTIIDPVKTNEFYTLPMENLVEADISSPTQTLMLVYCDSTEMCEYQISISETEDALK